ILSRLAAACRDLTEGLEGVTFQDSLNAAYGFAWNELCDWYLESVKERLRAGDAAAQDVAYLCLDNLFRVLHPFMPFVTEELWSRLPGERDYVMRADWPQLQDRFVDPGAEEQFGQVMTIVEEIRGHRQAAGAPRRGGQIQLDGSIDRKVGELAAKIGQGEQADDVGNWWPKAPVRGQSMLRDG